MGNPIGIDGRNPYVSWVLSDGEYQSAYEILFEKGGKEIFTTGKVQSNDMHTKLNFDIPFKTKGTLKVFVWDENNKKSDASEILVVTGKEKNDWTAKWINPELENQTSSDRVASYLKSNFQVDCLTGPVFLYATCHGIMNIYINGKEITNFQFMPGRQQYNKRLMVETIEITDFVTTGENEVVVSLGDGFYRGSLGNSQVKNVYGTDISLLLQIESENKILCVTDETWKATQTTMSLKRLHHK